MTKVKGKKKTKAPQTTESELSDLFVTFCLLSIYTCRFITVM